MDKYRRRLKLKIVLVLYESFELTSPILFSKTNHFEIVHTLLNFYCQVKNMIDE